METNDFCMDIISYYENADDELVKMWLNKELKEFLKKNPMTKTERKEIRKWVKKGHSVYTNGCYYAYENGWEMNFLDALRFEEELIKEHLEKNDSKE
jgi:hypothetical protein